MKTKWEKKYLLGVVNGEKIYLSPPSWNCGWYWGFGYLGNKNCHYHLNRINRDKNLYEALKEHFGDTLTIKDADLWVFCELVMAAYSLKDTAEVLGRGGSHYTANPCKDLIINKNEVTRINSIVLPAIFDQINLILERK